MGKRIRWKIIFIFSLLLTIYTLNQNFNMPVTDSGGHPDLVAYGVLLFDFLVLLGSFGYAFKLKIFKLSDMEGHPYNVPFIYIVRDSF